MEPGTTLGQYEVHELLGAGGMGEVWLATDTRLGRQVAIKILPEAVSGNPQSLARFEREAKAIALLEHSNIVTVYAIEEIDGVHLIAMQLIDGESLAPIGLGSIRELWLEFDLP